MEKIFENEIEVEQSIEMIREYLNNPENLSEWNYAVTKLIKIDDTHYTLFRNYEYGQEEENVVVSSKDDSILFTMSGGRVNYSVEFQTIEISSGKTRIHETICIDQENSNFVSGMMKLMQPFVKNAFHKNLVVLKTYFENIPPSE